MSEKYVFNIDLIIDRYFELNPKILLALEKQIEECLKPKEEMAPIDDLWVTSPRTSREFF